MKWGIFISYLLYWVHYNIGKATKGHPDTNKCNIQHFYVTYDYNRLQFLLYHLRQNKIHTEPQ